ncbi:Protein SERAC1 [Paramyrothecium foliicola]|nr:Protein SERAC1 [Paramyrothecium foliicola]
MPGTAKAKVYRLRNIPTYADRLAATQLLATAINDSSITANDIQISSLAPIVESWKRWQTKVATLTFTTTPALLLDGVPASRLIDEPAEWRFYIPGSPEPLLLDTHFHGLTVLNEVRSIDHQYDCIIISGLASHPFGSWQPKGEDKSFMWIRDSLTQGLPNTRFLLYGYNTSLVNSKSFQTIVDIARTLLAVLEASLWTDFSTKPFLFLAHSLGGVILKQALVMLADGNDRERSMLGLVRGAIFFGTPSVGMPLSHLLRMVEDQPNKDLVEALSDKSPFLANLEVQFTGISFLEGIKLLWAYETQTSSTVEVDDNGQYKRIGPRSVMVDPHSATHGRHFSDPLSTLQIDEDHSNMVKFPLGHHVISIIVNKLRIVCQLECDVVQSIQHNDLLNSGKTGEQAPQTANHEHVENQSKSSWKNRMKLAWNQEFVLHALKPPERDIRLSQVGENFGHTFNWAFDDRSTGLTEWLRRGKGLYWISGKPGSGKSTFMKFLLNDNRTKELLHKWNSSSSKIMGNFFFYHRGTLLQKSFDGLLRSLLSQLLEKEPLLFRIMSDPILDKSFEAFAEVNTLGTLEADLEDFFGLYKIPSQNQDELIDMVAYDPVSLVDSLLKGLLVNFQISKFGEWTIKTALLDEFQDSSSFAGGTDRFKHRQAKIRESLYEIEDLQTDKNSQEREELIEDFISQWCNSTNFKGVTKSFIQRHKRLFPLANLSEEDDGSLGQAAAALHSLARRQECRQKARIDIIRKPWGKYQLGESLGLALTQDVFDLELCLFFDALDEYGGQHEVLCDFLKDLVTTPSGSRTKTKVLFSSRPWPVFRDEFSACNGFELHKYTEDVIREYCTSSLPTCSKAEVYILPLAEDIVSRSRGVFLWVKLVIRDLTQYVDNGNVTGENMDSQLRQCLESLPDELDDYYSSIARRIPSVNRVAAFILLEALSKSSMLMSPNEARRLINTGLAKTYSECLHQNRIYALPDVDRYLKGISGGLVDIVDHETTSIVQLLHQTCKEWVESSSFKHIMLGSRANVMQENGHGFLVKYYSSFLETEKQECLEKILFHAKQSEKTTGVSQYQFLSGLPPHHFSFMMGLERDRSLSTLSMIIYAQLLLCLADFINRNPNVIMNNQEPLLTYLLSAKPATCLHTQSSIFEAGKILIRSGFHLHGDPGGIFLIMKRMWECADIPSMKLYAELVKDAVRCSLDPNFSFGPQPASAHIDGNSQHCSSLTGWAAIHGVEWKLLHFSPPILARWLLENGSDVNGENDYLQTALDYVISPESIHQDSCFGVDWLYETACLLVCSGGILLSSDTDIVGRFLQRLSDNGYDISPLIPLHGMAKSISPDQIRHSTGLHKQSVASQAEGKLRRREKVKKLLRLSRK